MRVETSRAINPEALARKLMEEIAAEYRFMRANELLKHAVSGPEFVVEGLEEVRRRAGRRLLGVTYRRGAEGRIKAEWRICAAEVCGVAW